MFGGITHCTWQAAGKPTGIESFSHGGTRTFDCATQNEVVHFRPNATLCVTEEDIKRNRIMSLILIVVVLLLLFGGGGGYYAHRNYGGAGLGGVLGLVFIFLVVLLPLWRFARLKVSTFERQVEDRQPRRSAASASVPASHLDRRSNGYW